jgi:ATP-dependent Lon protease
MLENYFFDSQHKDEGDVIPFFSVHDEEHDEDPLERFPDIIPLLALKNTVLFPGVVIPITVGRDKSLQAIQKAHATDKMVGVVSQKDGETEYPKQEDLYEIGTVARILKLLKMPDGSTTAILQGRSRFRIDSLIEEPTHLTAAISITPMKDALDKVKVQAILDTIRDKAQRIIELSPNIPSEAVMMLKNIKSNSFLVNFIASNLNTGVSKKQEILAENDPEQKASIVLNMVNKELQLLEIRDQIENKVKGDIEKQQRDYYLAQQLKTIQQELGQNPQDEDIQKLILRAKKKDWPKDAEEKFNREIERLRRTNPQIAEYSLILSYLETMLDLPWNEVSKDNFNLKKVKKILDKDHFGLEKVKERIIEHLAVLKLKGDMKAPILCLVGPPGVGKTSLGKSVAEALNRQYIRMSLGGLHDESEIRGHRKTYIGAMPGRIIQSIKKAKTSNPVFILDEIDKIGNDFRGDPSSALLEVLDPEQNTTFHDNYLELEYDLSKTLFIATANNLAKVQRALLDRMEIIRIEGYSVEEKVEIAKRHLIPKQLREHGLKKKAVNIRKDALEHLVQKFTRESGVRNLDRTIAKIMRKVAKKVAMDEEIKKTLTKSDVNSMLGPTIFSSDVYNEVSVPGVAIGLAWTSTGGDILFIESSLSRGKGKLTLTGNLGNVMKESATTALSFVKAHSDKLGIDSTAFEKNDIHIHVPEGAIPKDGPSAGMTMLTTLASAFTGKKVKPYLAMTGEITLRGKLLPVGGIKEKILAAKRAGIKEILLCADNKKHVDQIDKRYIAGLNIVYIKTMKDAISYALG